MLLDCFASTDGEKENWFVGAGRVVLAVIRPGTSLINHEHDLTVKQNRFVVGAGEKVPILCIVSNKNPVSEARVREV